MATLRAILLIGLTSLLVRAHAAQFDVFLQIVPGAGAGPAPVGGSVDPIYSGWIDVLGFESGAKHDVNFTPVFPPPHTQFREFTIVKKPDSSTAALFKYLTTGALANTVKMVIAVQGPIRVELWKMTASTCFFTKLGYGVEAGEPDVQERLTFVAGKMEWAYTQISASGDAVVERFANWSVIDETGTVGNRTPSYLGKTDSDGDGIPDDWESFYGLNPDAADADSDFDGDGLTALEEFIAHTDPNLAQSTFRVTALQPAAGGTLALTWQSMIGLKYRVFTAPAPEGPYTFLKNVTSAGTGTTSTTVPMTGAQFFYKVVTP